MSVDKRKPKIYVDSDGVLWYFWREKTQFSGWSWFGETVKEPIMWSRLTSGPTACGFRLVKK